jgi:hypothetical protein
LHLAILIWIECVSSSQDVCGCNSNSDEALTKSILRYMATTIITHSHLQSHCYVIWLLITHSYMLVWYNLGTMWLYMTFVLMFFNRIIVIKLDNQCIVFSLSCNANFPSRETLSFLLVRPLSPKIPCIFLTKFCNFRHS